MGYETKNHQDSQIYQLLLNELLHRSSQAIVLVNSQGEITFCSESIQHITGFDAKELRGKTVFEFFHPNDLSAAKQQHEYLIDFNENASAGLKQIRNKEGNMIWVDIVVSNMMHIPSIHALFVLLKKSSDAGTEERKLVQAITEAKEQEREFLATELHDNINQIITATKLLIDTARLHPNKEELLQLSSLNLQTVADEIRKLSYSMVSYDLKEFGLSYALKAFVNTITRTGTVKIQTVLDEEALSLLSCDQQLHLYRIIQEGTNNILRHAAATQAEIRLSRQDDLIYLVIADNGKGFSMNRHKPGIGLSSITNRVKLLKGHFFVRAPQGTGTTVEIHFPV